MKAATIINRVAGIFIIPFFVFCLALQPFQAWAQEGDSELSGKYSREELAQLLAPVALYPDALLTQVLMASTYPIEVIEADRWIRKNPELRDEALDDALLSKDWDPSVKALCHFPSILALMSERITETTSLGNAFLVQEDEVMAMVQELRARAYAEGNLTTNSRQNVIVEKETIIIEPADYRVIYVPYYDPFFVYGPWWYPDYPPYYWGPPGVIVGIGISYWPGFSFSFTFGTWSYFDWHRHFIFIDVHKRPRFVRRDRWMEKPGRWHHEPRHRRGVAYYDKSTARKYGQYPGFMRRPSPDIRGFPERMEPNRSVDRRTGIDRDMDGGDRTRTDRERQERSSRELERKKRERADRDRLEQTTKERAQRQRVERERADRERQMRERVDRDRLERTKIEREQQQRRRAESDRQTRQRVESQQQERRRDTVFNRVEEGRRERESSNRGRMSRQGGRDDGSRGRSRSGSDERGDREDRGRNRR